MHDINDLEYSKFIESTETPGVKGMAVVNPDGSNVGGGTSGGAGTEYTDGASTVAHPKGGIPVFDKAGVITAVSDTNPLPVSASIDTAGLATSAKQDTGNTSIASIDSKMDYLTKPTDTQPVSAVSLPLPTGASTGAKQDTGNSSLSSIDTKVTDISGIKTNTDKIPSLGQALAAGSVPVVLTAAQLTTLTPPAAITGFATEAGHIATIDTSTAAVNTVLGAKTDAKSTATDGTSTSITSILKQISASVQAPPSQAVTNSDITSCKTALELIDNSVDGNYLNVNMNVAGTDVVSGSGNATGALRVELPTNGTGVVGLNAGTNAIGKLLPPDIDVTAHTNYARKYYTNAGAVTDGIVWSPAAGKRWHVTSLYFQTSADATITFEDDKAGGDDPVLKGEFKAGSGLTLTFDEKYPFASGEDAADLLVTTSAGNIYITVVGYEI